MLEGALLGPSCSRVYYMLVCVLARRLPRVAAARWVERAVILLSIYSNAKRHPAARETPQAPPLISRGIPEVDGIRGLFLDLI